jgi:hypothetical protein
LPKLDLRDGENMFGNAMHRLLSFKQSKIFKVTSTWLVALVAEIVIVFGKF